VKDDGKVKVNIFIDDSNFTDMFMISLYFKYKSIGYV